ncbi:MAG: hydrolase, partial [Flavobacteriaceae bacterium]
NGLEFYAVNNSFPNEDYTGKESRKIAADLFIDDRNIGGFIGWGEVYQKLTKEDAPNLKRKRKSIFSFLKFTND